MRLLGPPATPPRNNLVGLLGPPVAEMNFTRSLSQSFTSSVSPLLLVQSSDTVWKLPAEAIARFEPEVWSLMRISNEAQIVSHKGEYGFGDRACPI